MSRQRTIIRSSCAWSVCLVICGALRATAQAPASPMVMTLGQALARGRSNGVQTALSRLAAEGVRIRRQEQGAALLPQIEASGTVQRQTLNLHEFGLSIPGFPAVTDPFTLFRARVSASQVLFDHALIERLRAARDTAIAAGLDAERAGDLTAATAGAAWLRLASAQETVTAREQDSVTAFALLDIARSQVDAGTAPRIDRTRSETRAAAVRVEIAVARNERDRAGIDLARATDLPLGVSLVIPGDAAISADTLPTDIAAAVALAQAHRVDLAAERAREVAIEGTLGAIRSEFIPSIAASGFVQTSGTGVDSLAGTWNIGVGLSWSIFDGFRRQRRVDEQQLRLDAERHRLHDIEMQIEADVREAALDVASAREQMSLASDRVRLATEELSEARERFAAGVTGSVETTNAQSELASARNALIQARLSAGAAQINAARALGLLDRVR
ncbi:MAG: TolC family protein [Gemmatimonadales bacterium]